MKRAMTLLLILAMLICMLAGCGSSTTTTTEDAAEESTATEATTEESTSADVTVSDAADDSTEADSSASAEATSEAEAAADNTSAVSFPLDEAMTVTLWLGIPPFMANYLTDSLDMSVFREMEEMTNIHFEVEFVNGLVESEQFNLMAAANSWTDIVQHGETMYGSGAYEDDIFIDLKDLISEYCPNLQSYMDNDESLVLNMLDEDGHILSFPKINYEGKTSEIWGIAYRGDYLDAIGADTPTTMDEFVETMTAVKNEFGSQVFCGSGGLVNFLYYAYDIELGIGDSAVPLNVIDGELHFGYYEDAAYDYFSTIHEWLESGLLYSEYLTADTSLNFEEGLVLDGSASTGVISLSILSSYNQDLEDGYLTGGPGVTLNEGDTLYAGYVKNETYNDSIWSVSTQCDEEKLPAIAAYVDYFFTDEGFTLINWGVEGESFEYDSDGQPYYTELITANPDGMSYTEAQYMYATVTGSGFPMIFDVDRDDGTYTEEVLAVKDIWTSCYSTDHMLPSSLTLSTDENIAFQDIWGDLSTYIQESTLKFLNNGITEEEFEEFRANLESYGVQDVIDLYQAAYDRYYSKIDLY